MEANRINMPPPSVAHTQRATGGDEAKGGGDAPDHRHHWLLAACVLFIGASVWFCLLQQPHPDVNRPFAPLTFEWWWHPLERNAIERLPKVPEANLNGVKFVDAKRGWAVGAGGVILHTADGGVTWHLQTNIVWDSSRVPASPPEADPPRAKSPAAASFSLISSAMAEEAAPKFSGNEKGPGLNGNRKNPQTQTGEPAANSYVESMNKLNALLTNAPPGGTQIVTSVSNTSVPVSNARTAIQGNNGSGPVTPPTEAPKPELRAVAFKNWGNQGWIVGERGTILHTEDDGEHWQAQSADTGAWLNSVDFSDAANGLAVGERGVILRTQNGGAKWTLGGEGEGLLSSVQFAGAQRGWIVAETKLLRTTNGGASWEALSPDTNVTVLSAACFDEASGGTRGWAFDSAGRVWQIGEFGGAWTPRRLATSDLTKPAVVAMTCVGGSNYWAADTDGYVWRIRDDGNTWEAHRAIAHAGLAAVSFVDAEQGWVVGTGGVILHTRDGGRTWSPQTWNAAVPVPALHQRGHYLIFPAPAYFLCLVGVGLLLKPAFRRPTTIKRTDSIADYYVSDRPLSQENKDALDFKPLVSGLAKYLRNERTAAPLVLSITGGWGSGKSSLMNLLREELEAAKFRPAWFNAWHHSKEEHLFAALLEEIRRQAIPNWWTWTGIMFRVHLARERFGRRWLALSLTFALAAAALAFLVHYAERHNWQLPSDLKLDSFTGLVEGLLKLWPLGAVAAPLIGLLKLLQAFGVDPAKMLTTNAAGAKASDLQALTSLRYRFAEEFKEVTDALRSLSPKKTLVLFIDDLDRCQPEQMMEVLEAVNYLATAGDCFIVLGMEPDVVIDCLASKLSWRIEAGTKEKSEAELQRARREYAEKWLEKLVQVRITVPSPDGSQSKKLMTGDADLTGEQADPLWLKACQFASANLKPWLPFLIVAVCVMLGVYGGYLASSRSVDDGSSTNKVATLPATNWVVSGNISGTNLQLVVSLGGAKSSAASAAADGAPGVGASNIVTNPTAARTNSPTVVGPIIVTPGQTPVSHWWLPVLLLLALGGAVWKVLSLRGLYLVDDSQTFRTALETWWPLIEQKHKTPRSLKRFVNRMRFYAMLVRDPSGKSRIPEPLVVGYGALRACAPGVLGIIPIHEKDFPSVLSGPAKAVIEARCGKIFGDEFERLERLTQGVRVGETQRAELPESLAAKPVKPEASQPGTK